METSAISGTNLSMELFTSNRTWLNETGTSEDLENTTNPINTTEKLNNMQKIYKEYPEAVTIFKSFIITEIVMTAVELIISIAAAILIRRWRRNYRNQMLVQLSLARVVKRIIFLFKFYEEQQTPSNSQVNVILNSSQIYIDFVIVILVVCFIKHMYDSLIIVLVKISQDNLYKILLCTWLLPVPISAFWTAMFVYNLIDEWHLYLLICCLFRWPIIFLGTSLYITILYQVLSDKIRKFARSLTIVTFLLCLVTNFYLFTKDVIELWCLKSLLTLLLSYLSGLFLNFLILCFYVILIVLYFNHNSQSSRSFPDYSLANVK